MARTGRKTGADLVLHIGRLAWTHPFTARLRGGLVAAAGVALAASFATYDAADPSLNAASGFLATNALGGAGAVLADIGVQSLGAAAGLLALLIVVVGLARTVDPDPDHSRTRLRWRAAVGVLGVLTLAGALAFPAPPAAWPLAKGLGGFWGDTLLSALSGLAAYARLPFGPSIATGILATLGIAAYGWSIGLSRLDFAAGLRGFAGLFRARPKAKAKPVKVARRRAG